MKKRILLADDHTVVREGIRSLVSLILNDWEICETGNEKGIVSKLAEKNFDMLVMDIHMPDSNTLGLMEFIRIKYPETKVLILSMSSEKLYAKRFIAEGAKGFLSKEASLEQVRIAFHTILSGRLYISEELKDILAHDSINDNPSNPFKKLSKREFEINSMLLSGQTLNEISGLLNLQSSTVGTHKARIFEKLEVRNLLELKELARFYDL